ncbi:unnamed protein product [Sphagnum troendelagicum]
MGDAEPSSESGLEDQVKDRHILYVSAGPNHTVALLSDNLVCSWGRGEDGQLGHGDAEERHLPTIISGLCDAEISSITCGSDHTTAYSNLTKTLYSWGWGDFGRLGHGNLIDLFIPHPVRALNGLEIKHMACGDSHCIVLTSNGEVLRPCKVQALERVTQVSCGWRHTVALTDRGNIYSWGRGTSGQLGHGDAVDINEPKRMELLSVDGLACWQIECSQPDNATGWGTAVHWIPPSTRYAIVPDKPLGLYSRQRHQTADFAFDSGGRFSSVPSTDDQVAATRIPACDDVEPNKMFIGVCKKTQP